MTPSLKRKIYPILLTIFVTMIVLFVYNQPESLKPLVIETTSNYLHWNYNVEDNLNGKWRKLTDNQIKNLSKLGRILYLEEDYPLVDETKKYLILIYKYGKHLMNRHITHWSNTKYDPFENCSVHNCKLTYNDSDIDKADLVFFHLQRIKGPKDLPSNKTRNPKQIWTFLTDESPYHTFMSYDGSLKDFNNIFNWSMTYSMSSDIPVPYGRTTALSAPRKIPIEEFIRWKSSKNKDVLIAIMGSNCGGRNHRWDYVKELSKHIKVDIYGGCGTLKCPGHFDSDCTTLSKYLFYLAFENSNCPEYLTEKLWWNAYSKEAIPIIMGDSLDTIKQLLPIQSYIHVEEFATPRDLANYLLYLNATLSELLNYYQWRSYFDVHNEHGYFKSKSVHYCRICEALNYNDKSTKVYEHLEKFWNANQCFPSWNDIN